MYNFSKDYDLLYELIKKGNVVCFVNYDFSRNQTDFVRDICQCKRTKSNDISFISRGHEYGAVNQWEIDKNSTELDLFYAECKSLDVEFIPF